MTLMIAVVIVSYRRCLLTQSHLLHVTRATSSVRQYPSGGSADLVGITFQSGTTAVNSGRSYTAVCTRTHSEWSLIS